MPQAPQAPQAPSSLGISSARLSGKFKAPGTKVLGTQPRMSAIRGSISQVFTQNANTSQALGPAARSRTGVFKKAGGPPSQSMPAMSSPGISQPNVPVAAPPAPEVASGFDSPRVRAEQHLQRGLDHYDRGEFDQAMGAYSEAILADPTFAMAYNNTGMVLIDLERYDEALNSLYESIGRDANYAEAYNNLGFVLRRLNRDVEAAAAYRRFLALEPEVEEGPRIAAWIEQLKAEQGLTEIPPLEIPGDSMPTPQVPPKIKKMAAWEAAAGDVATAAPVNALGEIAGGPPAPAFAAPQPAGSAIVPPIAPRIGTQRISVHREETAEEKTNRCIALIEKSLDEFEAGNIPESRQLAEQALDLNPENSEAHTALAKVLVREEKLEEGIQHLEHAIEIDSLDPAPFYVLGFTLRAMERNVEAAEIYEKFLTLMPDAVDAAKMRQWIQHIKGIAHAEVADHEEDGFEDNAPIVTETDRLYKAALDKFKTVPTEETVAACQEILAQAPEHSRTRVLLGRAHLRTQDFDNAAAAFAAAFEQDPDCSEALYFMGQCEEKRGDSPRALKLYRSYVENYPDGPRVERLQAWFLSHGVAETGKGLSQQIQCEWCLRFFDESEISLHENKATCNGCLTLMGSTPIQDAASLETVDLNEDRKARAGGKAGGLFKRLAVLGALGVAAVAAMAMFTNMLDPILNKYGLKTGGIKIAKGPTKDPGDKNPKPPIENPNEKDPLGGKDPAEVKIDVTQKININFDPTKVKIANAPERDFAAFTRWTWKPELEGVEGLDQQTPGWKKEFIFKDRPIGMSVDNETGTVVWNSSEYKDYDALKKGQKFNVELTIKGSWMGQEGARRDLFAVSRAFSVTSQFGYELGQELDVGLTNDTRNIQFAPLGGDATTQALGVLYGTQSQGGARALLVGADGPKRMVPLIENARSAAACEFQISEPALSGVLVSNWKTGEAKMLFYKGGNYEQAASVKFPPGTMALTAFEVERGKLAVAAFSSAMGTLSVSTYTPSTGFSALRNVQLAGGGGNTRLLGWKSEKRGPGFVAVMPLAGDPVRFVALNAGNEKEAEPVRSPMQDEGVITAALSLNSTAGPRRLAIVLGGKNSHLLLFQEKDGLFTQTGTKTALNGPGLGAVSGDFNQDGCDDLFVIMKDEACFYFLGKDDSLAQGPTISNPGMMGPAAILNVRHNSRPDIVVLNENKKARLLKPVGAEPTVAPKVANKAEVGQTEPTK